MNISQKKLQEQKARTEQYQKEVVTLEKMHEALAAWGKTVINKNFFTDNNIIGKITTERRYSGSVETHLYLPGVQTEIVMDTRKRYDVISAVSVKLDQLKGYVAAGKCDIITMEGFDQDALREDLVALFRKHGSPAHWNDVIKEYSVYSMYGLENDN